MGIKTHGLNRSFRNFIARQPLFFVATAAHLLHSPRMTLMFCACDGDALTLRVPRSARAIHPRDDDWCDLYKHFPDHAGARNIDLVTTSCGTGIREMTVTRPRATPNGSRGTLG